jgi:hypothetical protein
MKNYLCSTKQGMLNGLATIPNGNDLAKEISIEDTVKASAAMKSPP